MNPDDMNWEAILAALEEDLRSPEAFGNSLNSLQDSAFKAIIQIELTKMTIADLEATEAFLAGAELPNNNLLNALGTEDEDLTEDLRRAP